MAMTKIAEPFDFAGSGITQSDNWIISTEEMINCTNEQFAWVKELELIEYKAKEPIQIV